MSDPAHAIELRYAKRRDRAFVARLSGAVFSRFGPYDVFLPEAMREAAVRTLVAELDGERIGFAIYALDPGRDPGADLLAIATAPTWQGKGVGRRLLERAEADLLHGARRAVTMRLTVAEDNAPGRRLFESAGYRITPGEVGRYPAGQRSLGMRKQLRPAP